MILNDIFMLPSSRPDLEVCTKFGTPGALFSYPLPQTTMFSLARKRKSTLFCRPLLAPFKRVASTSRRPWRCLPAPDAVACEWTPARGTYSIDARHMVANATMN